MVCEIWAPPHLAWWKEVSTILAPLKHPTHSFAARGRWKFGVNLNLHKPLERIHPNFNTRPHMKLPTNGENLVKMDQGIRPCGAFLCQNFGKIFSLGASHPTPMGVNLEGRSRPLVDSSTPNFTQISATCRPCGRKTSKSPRVTKIPALYDPCNAAGKNLRT